MNFGQTRSEKLPSIYPRGVKTCQNLSATVRSGQPPRESNSDAVHRRRNDTQNVVCPYGGLLLNNIKSGALTHETVLLDPVKLWNGPEP